MAGSGLDGIMDTAKLPYIGLKTAFCDVNDVKKALYAVEVVAICLYKQLSLTHSESETLIQNRLIDPESAQDVLRFGFPSFKAEYSCTCTVLNRLKLLYKSRGFHMHEELVP